MKFIFKAVQERFGTLDSQEGRGFTRKSISPFRIDLPARLRRDPIS